ncbi:MAG: LEA type 2 family protein [Spirochaetes bacterium]|nr:LEA type 2 family protein [Spirochaetota bacterium]MBU0957023.1 LEA type 2 family protein [Spirochaetota bacterium]
MIQQPSGASEKNLNKGPGENRKPALKAKTQGFATARLRAGRRSNSPRLDLVKLQHLAMIIISLFLAAACANQPEPLPLQPDLPETPAHSELVLIPGPAGSQAIDQFSVSLACTVEVVNTGATAIQLGRLDFVCTLDQNWQQTQHIRLAGILASGESRQVEWTAILNPADDSGLRTLMENPQRNELTWKLEAEALATVANPGAAGDGTALFAAASADGVFPLIREPVITIASMHLLKHDLVNVRLALSLDIHNPNVFPLIFESTEYDFFGEGRRWNKQRHQSALTLPPDAHTSLQLPLTLNFADMNRRLLDLVAGKGTVAYKLTGDADIRTGLDYLPQFTLHYDRQGSIKVE